MTPERTGATPGRTETTPQDTATPTNGAPLLRVDDLVKTYAVGHSIRPGRNQLLVAVDHVSFDVTAGETLGVVGESGCGKSTLARCLLGLESTTEGSVWFNGRDLSTLSKRAIRHARQKMQMVFQDPYDSLNPRRTVGDSVMEPLLVHKLSSKATARKKAAQLFDVVGLSPRHLERYPREFSGGQRQRIGVARALASSPELIVADEPVSALDVSIQAQVINLMCDLQESFRLSYVFISHDLEVIRYVSDRIVVMYLGQIMELGNAELLAETPAHPYTVALLGAVPELPTDAQHRNNDRIVLRGEVPSPINRPPACPFQPRCPVAQDRCAREKPPLRELPDGRLIACHFPNSLTPPR